LGKYRINVRHASNELSWQVEDNNDEGLTIKRHIIRQFDKEDVRTFGLCFAIKTQLTAVLFGSVLIERRYAAVRNKTVPLDSYDIYYTQNFNPNSSHYILFREAVKKEHLDTYLISVCKYYYEMQREETNDTVTDLTTATDEVAAEIPGMVYQCSHCLTVYDETEGDIAAQIPAGMLFIDLPGSYACPLCEAPKEDFVIVERAVITA
jgi:rubredoxin